jgi:hypothetical protein
MGPILVAVAGLCLIFLLTSKKPTGTSQDIKLKATATGRRPPDELPVAYKSDVEAWYNDAKQFNERHFMFCHDGRRKVDMCLTLGSDSQEHILETSRNIPYLKIFHFFDTERPFEEQWEEYVNGETKQQQI